LNTITRSGDSESGGEQNTGGKHQVPLRAVLFTHSGDSENGQKTKRA
jgi:hypothetical protein